MDSKRINGLFDKLRDARAEGDRDGTLSAQRGLRAAQRAVTLRRRAAWLAPEERPRCLRQADKAAQRAAVLAGRPLPAEDLELCSHGPA